MQLPCARATLLAWRLAAVGDGLAIGPAFERGLALVDVAENLLAQGKREGEVLQALKLGRKRGMRVIGIVRRRWARDGKRCSREERKAENRAIAVTLRTKALEKTRAVPVGDGPGISHLEHTPDPDIRSAIEAHRLVCEMDGDVEHNPSATSTALAMQLAMILGIEVAGMVGGGGGEVIDVEGVPVDRGRLPK